MRMTQLFGLTLRQAPADAQTVHHNLLTRAAYLSPHQPGVFTLLPLGERFAERLTALVLDAIDPLSPQFIQVPPHLSSPSILADLLSRHVRSHKHLPVCLYWTTQVARRMSKSGLGLFQILTAQQIQAYAISNDRDTAQAHNDQFIKSIQTLFDRCRMPYLGADTHLTAIWDGLSSPYPCRGFYYPSQFGNDTLLTCPVCGYSAHRNVAKFDKKPISEATPREITKVATPECKTITALARFLDIPETQTAKAVFLVASLPKNHALTGHPVDIFVFAILRGDMDLDESKLTRVLGAIALRPATDAEIRAVGAIPGYASPVGLHPPGADALRTTIVVDDVIPASPNLVGGANIEGHHFINVNYGRDFQAQVVADIAACQPGYACPHCAESLQLIQAVEIARIGLPGIRLTEERHDICQDENGEDAPIALSVLEIDLERLMACVVEANHDDDGMTLPAGIAPYDVHLVYLPDKNDEKPRQQAEALYEAMQNEGWQILYDDRDERPGVKFNDADLIGIPYRITVATRSLAGGGVEFKPRTSTEREIIPMEQIISRLKEILH